MSTKTNAPSAWHRALHDPQLRALPYKIETNTHDQIILSPHKPFHSTTQVRIVDLLRDHIEKPGVRGVEFPVETSQGVKVPDVVWCSAERAAQIPTDAEASPIMPELVVEVLSTANTKAEMAEKRALYPDEDAQEVWLCAPDGTMTFYDASGRLDASALVPSFPAKV